MNPQQMIAKATSYWLFVGEPPTGTFQRVAKSTAIALSKSKQADAYEWTLTDSNALFMKRKYFP